jgi:hypothetical protein
MSLDVQARCREVRIFAAAFAARGVAAGVRAETPSGPALVTALRSGGYVVVMRHASSPPDAACARRG